MTGRARAGRTVVCGGMQRRGESGERVMRLFLAGLDAGGVEEVAYVEVPDARGPSGGPMGERDMIRPFQFAWDIGPDGRVFVAADWERYAIRVSHAEGKADRVIEREYPPWRRTAEERQQFLRLLGAAGGEAPPFELDDYAPTVSLYQRGIQVREDGELWVLTSRGNRALPDGVLARFDVFDAQGHFRRQVEVQCPGDPWNDRLIFLPADHVIRIRRFVDAFTTSLGPGGLPPAAESAEDAAPAVICYRIKE
jgi:hypothetical protein